MIKLPQGRSKRLGIIILIVATAIVAVSLVMFALQESISVFHTPTQVVNNQVDRGHIIRVGGMVKPGSVTRNPNSLKVSFIITDTANEMIVHYTGSLPDLFKEGKGVVVQGRIDKKDDMYAQQVLAKHDENYMPPGFANKSTKKKAIQVDAEDLIPESQQVKPDVVKE